MKKVVLTKKYSNGRIVSVKVSSRSDIDKILEIGEQSSHCTELRNEMKRQDEKYYNAIHTDFDFKEVFEAFEDLCNSQVWD